VQLTLKIGGAKFHIKRAISEMGRATFREILIAGAQFANFPVWVGIGISIFRGAKTNVRNKSLI
jgi:hypothetical protein